MASDASKQGFGACFGKSWIQGKYPPPWQKHHITVLELYPIYALTVTFGCKIQNSNILFRSDNKAVTDILNKQSSKNPKIMKIVRPLVLILVKFNIGLRMEHLAGSLNILPDKISRFQVTKSLIQEYKMNSEPTPVNPTILPENWSTGWTISFPKP